MKDNNFINLLYKLFFIAIILVTLGGFALFLTILYGVIVGGDAGSAAIIWGQKKLATIYEGIMGIGVFIGIISIYITKSHSYKIEKTNK
ncbi:MAG: hypothetical protein GX075_05370 [Firmicutes bacterium]|nr:hypothetical protein [Bacillota bacterium]